MTTTVILLFGECVDPYAERPTQILGPFTDAEASMVAKHLTCAYIIEKISTSLPEWAT